MMKPEPTLEEVREQLAAAVSALALEMELLRASIEAAGFDWDELLELAKKRRLKARG